MTATSLPAELSASLSALLREIQNNPKGFMLRNLSEWEGWLEERGYSSSGLADFLLSNLQNQKESKINSALIVNAFTECCERSCSTGEFVQSLDRYDTGFIEDYISALIPSLQSYADILTVAGGYNHPKAHAFEANHPGADAAEGMVGAAILGFFVYMCCKKYIRKEVARGAQEEINLIVGDPRIDNGVENSRQLRDLELAPGQNIDRVAENPEAALSDSERYLADLNNSEEGGLKGLAERALNNQESELYRYLHDKGYFKEDLYPDVVAKYDEIKQIKSDIYKAIIAADTEVNSGRFDSFFGSINKPQWKKFITIEDLPNGSTQIHIDWSELDTKIKSIPATDTLSKYLNWADPDFLKNIEKYRNFDRKLNEETAINLKLLNSREWDRFLEDGTAADFKEVWNLLNMQRIAEDINVSVVVEEMQQEINESFNNFVKKETQSLVANYSDEMELDKEILRKFAKSIDTAALKDFDTWTEDVTAKVQSDIAEIST